MSEEGGRLLHLAEQDPQACIETCGELLAVPDAGGLHNHAHRALGIARRELGQMDEATRELELARDGFRADGDGIHEAETEISLSALVAMSGRLADAVAALDPLTKHESQSIQAHAMVQKASVIAHMGDLRGAIGLYDAAQPILEELGDFRWLAILHGTRGMVESFLSEFDAAEVDFEAATDLYLKLDQSAPQAEMAHNLGLVAVQRGDIARGLGLMLEAEGLLQTAGVPTEATSADRAYAYMLAGLPSEAFQVASRLARQLGAQGRELERAEALYLAARAALADGSPTTIEVADEAARVAAEQGRLTWELLASLVREEARLRGGLHVDPGELVDLANQLSGMGMPSAATRGLALAALSHLLDRDIEAAAKVLDNLPSGEEVRTELPSQLLVAVANAKVSMARDESAEAIAILEGAADQVDRHREMLSATEARAGVSRLADEIAVLGLEAMHGSSSSVVAWADRFRGASLRVAPVVMNPDTELALALSELRPIVRDLVAPAMAGEDTSELAAEARRLEDRIRDLAMARDGTESGAGPDDVDEALTKLGPPRLMYMYDVKGRTYAEVTGQDGTDRVYLGDSDRIRLLARHLLSALRSGFMRGRSRTAIGGMIDELAGLLLSPLVGAGAESVVVPPPDLLGIPWTAMAGAISPDVALNVAPSAGLWARAHAREQRRGTFGVVAGPRLAFAANEAEQVQQLYGDTSDVLTGEAATVGAVLEVMGRCDRLHAVAHTLLRDDNPMFSALELSDGFLNLYDLEGLQSVPDTVVLSACDSAQDNVVGGHEMYGLTSVLLSRGTRSVIATVAPLPDSAASVEAVVRIHTALKNGASAAAAVRDAQLGFSSGSVDPSVAFVAYGG